MARTKRLSGRHAGSALPSKSLPDLRQARGRTCPAVLLAALQRRRSPSVVFRRLRHSGGGERRRCRRGQGRAARPGRATSKMENQTGWPDQLFDVIKGADVRQVGYVPDAGHARADRSLQGRQRYPRCRALDRRRGHRARGRRLARPPAHRAANAVERGRQLHQHALADEHVPLPVPHLHHDARRVGRVQSVAGCRCRRRPSRCSRRSA